MSSTIPIDSAEAETCVVCFKTASIFSIGECDHPVCYECSTRMRVLCRQNECPICRQDLGKVSNYSILFIRFLHFIILKT